MKRIIISRVDSIGDVVLTLPVAGVLKEIFPDYKIIFLGRHYTKPVIESCINIDEFADWDEIKILNKQKKIDAFKALKADAIIHILPKKEIAKLAKQAGIGFRMGVMNRFYNWFYCNFMMLNSRKNSPFHESQLNLRLLKPFGIHKIFSLDDIPKYYGLQIKEPLNEENSKLLSPKRFNLILHPKSKGSSREWGLDNYSKFIELIHNDGFYIFVTGTEEEGLEIRKKIQFEKYNNVKDMTGKLSLRELISFINSCDGLIAGSTGPLHIAAALGKLSIGLYPPIKPMHPGRWAPIGNFSSYIVKDIKCNKCRRKKRCKCLEDINPEEVRDKLNSEM